MGCPIHPLAKMVCLDEEADFWECEICLSFDNDARDEKILELMEED